MPVDPVQSQGMEAEELILIPRGVQIFFVKPNGKVSIPSYPGSLRIIKFKDTNSKSAQNRPPAFLQVCDWLSPLMRTQSPVLRTNTGVYMFPDMMTKKPGSYVGVVLSAELPSADVKLFENLLRQMCELRIQPGDASGAGIDLSQTVHITIPEDDPEAKGKKRRPLSEKVAKRILQGASVLSSGLVKGGELTGKAIQKGGSKIRKHIKPEDKTGKIHPIVTEGLRVAKNATSGAVKVSQILVDGVCAIASRVAKEFGPHVKKHCDKLMPEILKKDKDGKSPLDGPMMVATSAVQGFATVWQALECAGKNIAKSVASETVHTVNYKYGFEAGKATDNAMKSAVNAGVIALNVNQLAIPAILETAAKETSNATLDEYQLPEIQKKEKEGLR